MLSLVLPTYNEAENLEPLFQKLQTVLGMGDEVIVVDDDSPDRTWEKAQMLTARFPWVRVLRRVGRRGLSSAVVEGFAMAKGDVLAVMDADLQHDPSVLRLLADAAAKTHGIAIGSRYVEGGGVSKEWASFRKFLSRFATLLTSLVCSVPARDPMSGYFAVDADVYRAVESRVHADGFKVLLEILAAVPRTTPVTELPFQFGVRQHGHSKLTFKVQLQFATQLLRLWWWRVTGR